MTADMSVRAPATSEDVLSFWLEEIKPSDWYNSSDALDEAIRKTFLSTWDAGMQGKLTHWTCNARGALAEIILLDQFPRNMFRDQAKAFSSDRLALATAKKAIDAGWDLKVEEPERQFFYMPLMHSEVLCDQDRCVRLMAERLNAPSNLLHAKAHRELIRRFGRFPYRNEALGRRSCAAEQAFLQGAGYREVLEELEAKAAA